MMSPMYGYKSADERVAAIRALLDARTAAEVDLCAFDLPDGAGKIVVERAEHGIHIWVSGYSWPVAMVDLYHRSTEAEADDEQKGAVLVQLSDYRGGYDPLRLCYLYQHMVFICDAWGEVKEVLSAE